jgi:hypothetical protein
MIKPRGRFVKEPGQSVNQAIKKYLTEVSKVVHFDETGLRIESKLHWLHVAWTSLLTYYEVHAKRGQEAVKPIWFLACEKFNSSSEGWTEYIAWARLPQLVEIVSLDTSLCQGVIKALFPEDWKYNVNEDYRVDFFVDLEYLLRRVEDRQPVNILAAIEEPDYEDFKSFHDDRFIFKGFDLVEFPGTEISALVNCGGFDKAFAPGDINPFGLISDYDAAKEIQQRLATFYPEEHHAHCELWARWRMESGL